MNIYFVADIFYEEYPGGGEASNDVLIEELRNSGYSVEKIKSSSYSGIKSSLTPYDRIIFGNFALLTEEDKINVPCKYFIIEHDYKFLQSRNPALYKDFIVPAKDIINLEFYKNAAFVLCQSTFQRNIIYKNLNLSNFVVLGGNLWHDAAFEVIESLNEQFPIHKKKEATSILISPIAHKNTNEAIDRCMNKGEPIVLIKPCAWSDLLIRISWNKYLMFLPKTPETLSRVVVEAKMLGVVPFLNENIGAIYEPWYIKQPEEIIQEMKNKKEYAISLFKKEL